MDKTNVCEAASRMGTRVVPYGYCIQSWYCKWLAISLCLDFYRDKLEQSRLSFLLNSFFTGPAVMVNRGYFLCQGIAVLSNCNRQPLEWNNYRIAAVKLFGARARHMGISASNFILPWLQQGQVVMSVPVSCSIISSRLACIFAGSVGNFKSLRILFKLATRFRLAKKP